MEAFVQVNAGEFAQLSRGLDTAFRMPSRGRVYGLPRKFCSPPVDGELVPSFPTGFPCHVRELAPPVRRP